MSAITQDDVDRWFTYHPPRGDQVTRYAVLREAARTFGTVLLAETPAGPDQTAALRKLRECVMTANAAIACAPESD